MTRHTLTPDRHLDVRAGDLGPEPRADQHQAHRQPFGEADDPLARPFTLPPFPFPDVIEGGERERTIERARVEVGPAEALGDQAGGRALARRGRTVDRDYPKHRFKSRKKSG